MSNVLNSYTRFFNTKYDRKGPLWVGRFKNIPIESDEQLLHLTRYVHLNPVTAKLVNQAEEWKHSSYREYIQKPNKPQTICHYSDVLDIKQTEYQDFVHDHASYQRELAAIKNLAIE